MPKQSKAKSIPAAPPPPAPASTANPTVASDLAAADIAANRSANPDRALLADIASELGISDKFETAPASPADASEPQAEYGTETQAEDTEETANTDLTEASAESSAEQPEPTTEDAPPPAAEPASAAPDPIAQLQASLAAIRDELASLRNPAPTAQPAPPPAEPSKPVAPLAERLLTADTQDELEAIAAEYGSLQDRCLENPDGFELAPARTGEAPRVVEADEVRRLLVESTRVLRQIPTRAREIERAAIVDQQALELYPAFSDPRSTEARVYGELVRIAPQLRRLPNLRLFIGDAVAHEKARQTAAKPAPAGTRVTPTGKPLPGAPTRPATSAPPPIPAPPARAQTSLSTLDVARRKELWRRQTAEGGESNLADLIETMLPRKAKSA